MDWDGLIGGLMSSPLLLLIIAVIGKLWPDGLTAFSTWLYSHVDAEGHRQEHAADPHVGSDARPQRGDPLRA